jgi:hypothetical protein
MLLFLMKKLKFFNFFSKKLKFFNFFMYNDFMELIMINDKVLSEVKELARIEYELNMMVKSLARLNGLKLSDVRREISLQIKEITHEQFND